MNTKIKTLVAATMIAAAMPMATAQTDVDLDTELGGRVAIQVEKKLNKKIGLAVEEEVRMGDNFGSIGRMQTTVAADYKMLDYVKVGLGYSLINPYSSTDGAFKSVRHRVMADVTGIWKHGAWTVTLKERLQATYRTGEMNEYQNPRMGWGLKSRLKVQYKASRKVRPYAYVELRNTLNAPVIEAGVDEDGHYVSLDDGLTVGEPGWFIAGWNGVYVNRMRLSVGCDYKIDKSNSIRLYLLADHVNDKVVDANAEGTKLKSYTRERGWKAQVCATYTLAF